MTRRSERVSFPSGFPSGFPSTANPASVDGQGIRLAGIVDWPASDPIACVVLTHCFTCNKDLRAIVRISRALADRGVAVLRYDWTGLGNSEGEFSATTFTSGLADVRAAIQFARSLWSRLDMLIGYSLGGAASLAVAAEDPSLEVATIGAPSDTQHLAHLLLRMDPRIGSQGEGEVTIGGRPWKIRKRLLDDLAEFQLADRLAGIKAPVMIIHAMEDETVGFDHALRLLSLLGGGPAGGCEASLISLAREDHLLTRDPQSWTYIADLVVAALVRRNGKQRPTDRP
jgi:uncharacterized protein